MPFNAFYNAGPAPKVVTIAVWLSISTNVSLATADVFDATPTREPVNIEKENVHPMILATRFAKDAAIA
jgi:hypothetical protein